ncbi:hypothetical protein PHYPSEUDO_004496 [Phytophthora pseudosyringae]|uniref:Uncharacterized protein n=1 Tax=Phytophthora pseudosyringae TaxID=221518 RepID=A0A8T1WP50_9STRA|nr:hypothetical protein PHYPSEUDO_004496 [Phytophthora pseudosyringae]
MAWHRGDSRQLGALQVVYARPCMLDLRGWTFVMMRSALSLCLAGLNVKRAQNVAIGTLAAPPPMSAVFVFASLAVSKLATESAETPYANSSNDWHLHFSGTPSR